MARMPRDWIKSKNTDAPAVQREAEEVLAVTADKKMPHSLDEAISATVLVWEFGKLGISYRFPDNDRQVHVIGVDDWPIIERLEKEGQVTFENVIARERWNKYLSRISARYPTEITRMTTNGKNRIMIFGRQRRRHVRC